MAADAGKPVSATKVIASLGVADLERALAFYQTFFGFQVADSYEADGRTVWCWLQTASADLMLQQLSAEQQITLNPAIGQSWSLYVRPDDIDLLHRNLKRAGFAASEIRPTAYATREFMLTDPDGYELWVSAPVEDDDA
jgi:uncharacterized glyoxalase superfamily protein PhnB